MYISEFGYDKAVDFAGWTIVATEALADEYGCSYTDGCPCCTCDANTVSKITLVRPRYSKSINRVIEEYRMEFSCSAHTTEFAW